MKHNVGDNWTGFIIMKHNVGDNWNFSVKIPIVRWRTRLFAFS
jgi:hypothetical protein